MNEPTASDGVHAAMEQFFEIWPDHMFAMRKHTWFRSHPILGFTLCLYFGPTVILPGILFFYLGDRIHLFLQIIICAVLALAIYKIMDKLVGSKAEALVESLTTEHDELRDKFWTHLQAEFPPESNERRYLLYYLFREDNRTLNEIRNVYPSEGSCLESEWKELEASKLTNET